MAQHKLKSVLKRLRSGEKGRLTNRDVESLEGAVNQEKGRISDKDINTMKGLK